MSLTLIISLSEEQAGFTWKPSDNKMLFFLQKCPTFHGTRRFIIMVLFTTSTPQYRIKNVHITLVCLVIVYWLFIGKSKDPDKALGLWTRMQEEDVQPSDEFLSVLGNFLKKEGREVPFVIPEIVEAPPAADIYRGGKKSHEAQETGTPLPATQKFRQALRRNNLDDALLHKQM
jgi:pentatricopeptide repeat protein